MASRQIAAGSRTRHERRGVYETEYKNADEAEWAALVSGAAHISQGTRDEMMSDAAMEFDEEGLPGDEYMTRESADEGLQAAVLEVVIERQQLLGTQGYPFELQDNSLVFTGNDHHPYAALLTLCYLPSVSSAAYKQAPVDFEYLSLIAARAYLGPRSDGWRFGWPRDNAAHLKVSDAAKELQRRSGPYEPASWQWNPSPDLPQMPNARDLRDAGMDFVAWLPWHDKGPGQMHLVGQCACGEDWKWKQHDLSLPKLEKWMRLPHPTPVRSLFTPRHLPLPTLRDATSEAGLIFDRIRIVQTILGDPKATQLSKKFAKRIFELGRLPPPAAVPAVVNTADVIAEPEAQIEQ